MNPLGSMVGNTFNNNTAVSGVSSGNPETLMNRLVQIDATLHSCEEHYRRAKIMFVGETPENNTKESPVPHNVSSLLMSILARSQRMQEALLELNGVIA